MSVIARRAFVAAILLAPWSQSRAAAGQIVSNPATGFAMNGFDPVAYFADRKARLGSTAHQTMWNNVGWCFANEGNRQAFLEAPAVYAPAYGGHCAVAVARGYPAEGDPRFWAIRAGRLYLFHTPTNRRVFLMDADSFVAAADREWPALTW